MKKKQNIIPKNFFNKKRKIITNKEALKDVIPISWDKINKEGRNSKFW